VDQKSERLGEIALTLGMTQMEQIKDERTERLTRVTRDMTHPNQHPRDSATLILIDRSGAVPKVLLGRRHARHTFMPDVFVFPGGRVDPTDRTGTAEGALDPRIEERLMRHIQRPTRSKARAIALAAIRETFEETGLLVGTRRTETAPQPGARWQDLAANGLVADLGSLHFIARAITPPRRPRRYDSRFFAADVARVRHRIEGVTGPDAELTELVWLPIPEAKELDMPAITGVALEELEARIAAGLPHDMPVPFYRMLHKRFVKTMI
jgi:8-oxo-dGTP pyrophosphatase MutT (NUDIX family)